MQEIFRSRDMTSLMSKKQFLEDNDIPGRILLDGTDLTDMPSHPVFGFSYHLEDEASLVVDDEDGRKAWNLLNRPEYSELAVGEGYYCKPGQVYQQNAFSDGKFDTDGAYDVAQDSDEAYDVAQDSDEAYDVAQDRSSRQSFGRRIIPSILLLGCLLISVVWLFYAILFVSALWLESRGGGDWSEDSIFIPVGILMILIWVVGAVLILRSVRKRR